MAITYISSSELIVGDNHPFFADIKNRAGQYIDTQMLVEHDLNGVHDGRDTSLQIEIGTYAGTGASLDVDFSNSNFEPLFVEIWYSHAADLPIIYGANNNQGGTGWPWDNSGAIVNCLNGWGTGGFTVYLANNTNRNGSTFYFMAYGYDNTTTMSPTGGSDPTWIEHGDDLDADVSGTGAGNSVEKTIEDIFLQEHNDAGTHSTNPFTARIEHDMYAGNGVDDHDISLTITDLDIKYCHVKKNAYLACLKNEDLAGDNTKIDNAAAFAADLIQDVTTAGQFQVGSSNTVNQNSINYGYLAIGA